MELGHPILRDIITNFAAIKNNVNSKKMLTVTFGEGYRPETSVVFLLCGTGIFLVLCLIINKVGRICCLTEINEPEGVEMNKGSTKDDFGMSINWIYEVLIIIGKK